MEKLNKLKCDFHNHPLCHFYYPANALLNKNIKLNSADKKDIRDYIDWCINERKLNAVAITDHDLIQSSLYARAYVEENNLPIKVITGAECEIRLKIDWGSTYASIMREEYVHLLVLGVEKIPFHFDIMTEDEMKEFIDDVHAIGGIVVMAHPVFSALSFYSIIEWIDGFEILNSDTYAFEAGAQFCEVQGLYKKQYKNSDYHYYVGEGFNKRPIPVSCNFESEAFIERLMRKGEKNEAIRDSETGNAD